MIPPAVSFSRALGRHALALVEGFRRHVPRPYIIPTSSGGTALQAALASLRLEPGDEVIVPALVDKSTVAAVLYQQAVPVFADVDPRRYTLDPARVERLVTPRTRAVIAVHLAGNPCELQPLLAIVRPRKISLVEDCTHAWGARWRGQPVGQQGDLACFSFDSGSQLASGGGVVATARPDLGEALENWAVSSGVGASLAIGDDAETLMPAAGIGEAQAAAAVELLHKLEGIAAGRVRAGRRLHEKLAGVTGVLRPEVHAGDTHSYGAFVLRLNLERLDTSRDRFIKALGSAGVVAAPGFGQRALYRTPLFQKHVFFGGRWLVKEAGLTAMDYRRVKCPVAEEIISDSIRLPVDETVPDSRIDIIARAVRNVAESAIRKLAEAR